WRFLDNPVPREIVCDALSDDKGVLRGYAIYYTDDHRFAHIMDFFAEDQEATTMELLTGLARRLRSEGVTSAVFNMIGSGRFLSMLSKLGFSQRGAYSPPPYELFVSNGSSGRPRACPVTLDWVFTLADDFHW